MKLRYNNNQNSGGFTLVEVLLYISIAVVVIGVVSSAIYMFIEIRTRNEVIQEVEQQGEFAMRTIKLAIQSAGSINSASGSTLSLATPDANIDPTVFSLTSDAIYSKEGTGANVALTNAQVTVSDLIFTNVSRAGTAGMVQIQFTVSNKTTSSLYQYSYSENYSGTAIIR